MLTGVILGVFIIPVLFVVFQFLHEKAFRPKPKKMALAPRAISAVRQAVTVILDRTKVVWGKSMSVRVDLGGGRFIKKKKIRKIITTSYRTKIKEHRTKKK